MSFNSTANRCTLKGYVSSDIVKVTDFSIEFIISVPRKSAQGMKTQTDDITVYVNKKEVCGFCQAHLKRSAPIIVKGEIRRFYDGNIKICSDNISLSSKEK